MACLTSTILEINPASWTAAVSNSSNQTRGLLQRRSEVAAHTTAAPIRAVRYLPDGFRWFQITGGFAILLLVLGFLLHTEVHEGEVANIAFNQGATNSFLPAVHTNACLAGLVSIWTDPSRWIVVARDRGSRHQQVKIQGDRIAAQRLLRVTIAG